MPVPDSARRFIDKQVERLRAAGSKRRIVFPEGDDPRVVEAAERLVREDLVQPILLTSRPSADGMIHIDSSCPSKQCDLYAGVFHERRRARGMTIAESQEHVQHPLYFGCLMVAAGEADGFVGGAHYTSRDTLRAMFLCIGTRPDVRTASSVFILAVPDERFGHNGLLALADCSIHIEPTPVELAEIAIATSESVRTLLETEPNVAMLSFSTRGSGKHKKVDQMVEALRIVRERAPDLNVDGEMQADAALVPRVGKSKAPGSTVAGQANTLIFPDLASGNIAYKMVERISGGVALGPFMQGLAKPANELSRGCSAEEIFGVAVITALQAEGDGLGNH